MSKDVDGLKEGRNWGLYCPSQPTRSVVSSQSVPCGAQLGGKRILCILVLESRSVTFPPDIVRSNLST